MTKQELLAFGVSIGWLTPEKAEELKHEFPDVVRCKDCREGALVVAEGMLPFVNCHGVDHELNWFCADGKPKDGEYRC